MRIATAGVECWFTILGRQSFVFATSDLAQTNLGNIRKRSVRRLNILFAEDVAHANSQMLRILEAVQNRLDVFGAPTEIL